MEERFNLCSAFFSLAFSNACTLDDSVCSAGTSDALFRLRDVRTSDMCVATRCQRKTNATANRGIIIARARVQHPYQATEIRRWMRARTLLSESSPSQSRGGLQRGSIPSGINRVTGISRRKHSLSLEMRSSRVRTLGCSRRAAVVVDLSPKWKQRRLADGAREPWPEENVNLTAPDAKIKSALRSAEVISQIYRKPFAQRE